MHGCSRCLPDATTSAGRTGSDTLPKYRQAQKTSKKVKFVNKEVLTLKSEIPKSMGDEAGTGKGVISGMNMDKVTFKKGSSTVKIEGSPCIYLTSMTAHNGSNANAPAGAQIAPSQTKVIVAP